MNSYRKVEYLTIFQNQTTRSIIKSWVLSDDDIVISVFKNNNRRITELNVSKMQVKFINSIIIDHLCDLITF